MLAHRGDAGARGGGGPCGGPGGAAGKPLGATPGLEGGAPHVQPGHQLAPLLHCCCQLEPGPLLPHGQHLNHPVRTGLPALCLHSHLSSCGRPPCACGEDQCACLGKTVMHMWGRSPCTCGDDRHPHVGKTNVSVWGKTVMHMWGRTPCACGEVCPARMTSLPCETMELREQRGEMPCACGEQRGSQPDSRLSRRAGCRPLEAMYSTNSSWRRILCDDQQHVLVM